MEDLQELNIIMVAPRGVGKTSLLAAMHEEFDKTFDSAGLTTWTTDGKTLDAIEDCKRLLQNMDYRLQRLVDPTPPQLDPWDDEGFVFEVGSGGRKFMRIRFTDPSGEYFKPTATADQKEYIREQLNECDAIIIPIDSTALMEKKTGRTKNTELGAWHEEKNDPARITKLLKDAYAGLARPRLVILAPLRCETYMKTDQDASDLLEHVKIGYRELLDFFKQDEQYHKLAVVVAPVQSIGHITFSHAESIDGFTRFFYNKVPLDAPYAPKDGDQPLRYVLRFLLNVFNEGRKLELKRAKQDLQRLEAEAIPRQIN
jgi:GTPase SAR1 family protein